MKLQMSIADYHKHPAISKSKLDLIDKSLLHYLEPRQYETKSMDFGQAVHDYVLSPDVFKRDYVITDLDFRTKAGKEFKDEHKDKHVLRPHEMGPLETIKSRLSKSTITRNILNNGEPEMSYFSKIKEFDVRCRPDYVNNQHIFDLKTTRSAKPSEFMWSIKRYRYEVQAAFYLDVVNSVLGTNIKDFIIIAIENTPPYAMAIYLMDTESIDLGRKEYLKNLDYLRSYQRGNFEVNLGYSEIIRPIGLPTSSFYDANVT